MPDYKYNNELEDAVAVVGMHCLFPGADSADMFWKNLCDGLEAVTDLSEEDLLARNVPRELLRDPDYVRSTIPLAGCADFDYAFFGVSPRDAAVMDPQHRKFLECVWSALEYAGHKPTDVDGAIGMFASCGMPWYLIRNVLTHRKLVSDMGEFQVRHLANDKDFLATRASYALNIHGPSLTVQTACSSSLVAVHLAAQSLLLDECDIAIAGGSTIDIPQGVGYLYREEEVRSVDGRCRAFDKDSTGTVFGSGCGAVVLRRLQDAIDDGDTIYAVLRGSAVNNDGSEKAGYMAPSVGYQANAIAEAIAVANVSPDDIGYFETHGTGTKIGDPIEVAALTQAFGSTKKKQYCGIGSAKSNVGHLDTAAGVASFIKAVQCVRHGKIPASLHYKEANPEIDFQSSPFYVSTKCHDWQPENGIRIAGVSSLGVGGTNAHAILQQPPAAMSVEDNAPFMQILPLSAKSVTALNVAREKLAAFLEQNDSTSLADAAYTLQEGRAEFEYRVAVAGGTAAELIESLRGPQQSPNRAPAGKPNVVFMFSGQGSQYPGMGAGLYEHEEKFKEAVDACMVVLASECDVDIRDLLFAARDDAAAAAKLQDTRYAQPALFTIEYALAQLAMSKGVKPDECIGHSLGEYVAATLSGVFELDQALRLVAARGRLIAGLPEGDMIAVPLPEQEVRPFLSGEAGIAAINGPELTVLSGSVADIRETTERLEAAGHSPRKLHTSHAFHSSMLDPVLDEFRSLVAACSPRSPKLPFLSNVTGSRITNDEATSADYWVAHMREPVRFHQGIMHVAGRQPSTFVELGPGNTLTKLTQMSLKSYPQCGSVAMLPHARETRSDSRAFHAALGFLWARGYRLNWAGVRGGYRGTRIGLPTYAFDKHSCWLDPIVADEPSAEEADDLSPDNWCSVQNWRQVLPPGDLDDGMLDTVVAFVPQGDIGDALADRLRNQSRRLVVVRAGDSFSKADDNTFTIDPASDDDFSNLAAEIEPLCADTYIHAWTLYSPGNGASTNLQYALDHGFFSLLSLGKLLQASESGDRRQLIIASADVHRTGSERRIVPENATLAGPLRVLSHEISDLGTRLIDFSSDDVVADPARCVERLCMEVTCVPAEQVIAWRGAARLAARFDPVTLPPPAAESRALRQEGVYLLTGAFGGIGKSVAEHLARHYKARLILLSRGDRNESSARLNSRQAWSDRLESLGAQVHCIESDLSDGELLHEALAVARQRFGPVDGVFHMAGRLDDGLVPLKSRASAAAVLQPKVQGTLALDTALRAEPPRFQVNFSSISTLAGLPGQIDYAAANAFLDAWASASPSADGERRLSVGWSSWSETGMALRSGLAGRLPTDYRGSISAVDDAVFSLFGDRGDGADFFGELWADKIWYLQEHRLRSGEALLPGTAYIELIADAFAMWQGQGPIEIRGLVFAAPLQFDAQCRRVVHCEFDPVAGSTDGGAAWQVTLYSWDKNHAAAIEHASATVATLNAADRPAPQGKAPSSHGSGQSPDAVTNPLLDFGPRWKCLVGRSVADGEAALELQLPSELVDDLATVPFHPAMLDIATGGAPELYGVGDRSDVGIVPFQFRRIQLWGGLENRVFSFINRTTAEDNDAPEADVRIVSDSGAILVDINGFCMRRVETEKLRTAKSMRTSPSGGQPRPEPVPGIGTEEGIDVLMRLLEIDTPPLVMVCPRPLTKAIAALQRRHTADVSENSADGGDASSFVERPELSTKYEAPASEIELAIAAIWQQVLGMSGIGTNDDFFELGGHSLLLTQVVSRLRREKGWSLPLDKVFDQVTIREWAALAADSPAESTPMPAIARLDRRRFRAGQSELKNMQ